MSEKIRIYVGTDPYQQKHGAEDVLEYSILKHCSRPDDVDITWMRANDPGWEISRKGEGNTWRVGAAVEGGWVKKPGSWGTCFSGFRFAIPELCGYEGRAIYLDSDMLLLGDIAELWEMTPPPGKGIRCINDVRTDVSVIDCSYFSPDNWPKISEMKPSGALVYHYVQRLKHHMDALQSDLPHEFNDCDGQMYAQTPERVKLIHYTNVLCGQPYRPYPNVDYSRFKWPYVGGRCSVEAAKLWWRYYQDMLMERHGEDYAQSQLAANGGVWQ